MEPTSTGLATLGRVTFDQVEALAAEKGAKLTRESESETHWRRHGRGSITITKERWYRLSTSDQKFRYLIEVWDFLLEE